MRALVLLATSGLAAATTALGLGPRSAGEGMGGAEISAPRVEAPQVAPPSYGQVLGSVRGIDPLACGLVRRSLQNRWGSGGVSPIVDAPDEEDAIRDAGLGRLMNSRPGAEDLEALLEGLGDRDRCVRNLAAEFLGWMRDPNPVDRLSAMVGGAPETTLPALRALGNGEWAEAVPVLVRALGSNDGNVRSAAAWALGGVERASTIDDLAAVLSDSDVSVRRTAVWALGQIERSAAVPSILPLLEDTEASVRLNAAWALGKIEDSAAIPALVARLTSDPDPIVRNTIAWALGQIE